MNKDDPKSILLDKFHVDQAQLIGSGMECEVYLYDHEKVLKVYNEMSDYRKQTVLKAFYSKIDSSDLSYELPYIYDIYNENGMVITIEKRMRGSNMQRLFSDMTVNEQTKMMETYLNANLELKSAKVESDIEGFVLFNENQTSEAPDNWYFALKEMVIRKKGELDCYFKRDVQHYNEKVNRLVAFLSSGYEGEYSLIHGDFYPGNLLANKHGKVTGLIDFGIMTMYGDHLFDIAIGWVCLDMYNELKANLYERYLNIIIATLSESVRKRLYIYVLIYSFLTANLYSPKCEDGHYQWCVKNLNNKGYWEAL
ncbi:thiamine kinase-like enzyme [Pullulanibacillus pueri]|uniref:Protein kinase domain-containing protein n=1 Tax=Pullulanibacillus pueri TaxID=1437324 RepID=A0A8J3EIW5_9BACL|nr:aminoglycoside phosphotransferase family protein [Pullulanibacillus pueri]MBM7679938.1 thiamine kinase-like enzyme [Pullulanibacillus pueri]GGH73581.1 hypothetical protein GCM10007096_00950 [Pullulanibacillus pueri]